MNITLARIDRPPDPRPGHNRLVESGVNAQRIIICNDEVYNDEVRRTLLRQAAPPGMQVNVVNIEKAVAVYHNPEYQDVAPFFIFSLAHRMP